MNPIIIRIPTESSHAFRSFWGEIRSAEGFTSEFNLPRPEEVSRFDGASLSEWIIPLSHAVSPILTCVLGFLVARRGEIEIDGKKFRNVTAKQVRQILRLVDTYERRKKR